MYPHLRQHFPSNKFCTLLTTFFSTRMRGVPPGTAILKMLTHLNGWVPRALLQVVAGLLLGCSHWCLAMDHWLASPHERLLSAGLSKTFCSFALEKMKNQFWVTSCIPRSSLTTDTMTSSFQLPTNAPTPWTVPGIQALASYLQWNTCTTYMIMHFPIHTLGSIRAQGFAGQSLFFINVMFLLIKNTW